VNSVLLAAPDGIVVDVEVDDQTERTPRSVVSLDWFTEARSGLITIAPVVVNPASGVSSVTVAAPARNPGSGVVGVVAIDVRGLDVLNALGQAQVASGAQTLLVDADGTVVVARDSRVVGKTLSDLGLGTLGEAIDSSALGTITGVSLENRGPQVAAFNEVYDGVTAVVLQPESVFLGPIDRLATITWFLFVVVGLLAVAAAVLLGRRLSKPVGVLTAAAVHIEANEPVDDEELARIGRSNDDVGRLARVFAKMAEQVVVRERRLREQVKALKVEIDHERRQRAVDEVTDTDFFRDLQGRAAEMRRRAKGEPVVPGAAGAAGESADVGANSEEATDDAATDDAATDDVANGDESGGPS
jgi:methyl-accepting chemotaxis protein